MISASLETQLPVTERTPVDYWKYHGWFFFLQIGLFPRITL